MDEILGIVDRFDPRAGSPPALGSVPPPRLGPPSSPGPRSTEPYAQYEHVACFGRHLRTILGDWPFTEEGIRSILSEMDPVDKRIFLRTVAAQLEKNARRSIHSEELMQYVDIWKREWIERFDRNREQQAAETLLALLRQELGVPAPEIPPSPVPVSSSSSWTPPPPLYSPRPVRADPWQLRRRREEEEAAYEEQDRMALLEAQRLSRISSIPRLVGGYSLLAWAPFFDN